MWGVPYNRRTRLVAKGADVIANRITCSAFAVTDTDMDIYLRRIAEFNPQFLYGYVSFLVRFANFIKRANKEVPRSLRAVVCTAEILDDESRESLRGILNLPIYNEYGCGEVGSIAHECEFGRLHVNTETLIVEIDNPNEAGVGEIVVTDLFNKAFPLIRYRLGDYGKWASEPCPCGRALPVIDNIYGRTYDAIVDPEQRWHHPESVLYVFQEMKEHGAMIDGFQVIQEGVKELRVNVAAERAEVDQWSDWIASSLRHALSSTFQVEVVAVDEIAREHSGKMKLVKGIGEAAA